MTTAPWAASSALTVLLPDPMPPVRPTWNTRDLAGGAGAAVRGDVHVVHVVGRGAAAAGHGPPPVARALHGPDVLVPDDLADAELSRVGADEVGDPIAEAHVGADHDVDRASAGVLAATGAAAPAGDDR